MDAPAISVAGVTKRYRQVLAVDNVSFDVAPGEILGLLGPNGAGKTTTMRVILGLAAPDQGDVLIHGHSIRHERERALAPVGTIIEEARFYPYLTGIQNLQQVARLRGLPTSPPEVLAVLDTVGLREAGRRRVRGYSLGMRQRLALGLALLQSPSVLILDEPMNGLDPVAIKDLRDRLLSMRASGVTIILSSHLLGEVEQLCDRVVLIDKGRLIGQDSLAHDSTDAVELRVRLVAGAARGVEVLAPLSPIAFAEEGDVVVPLLPPEQVPEVVRLLVGAGLDVYGVSASHPTLEQRYLEMTAGAANVLVEPEALAREGAGS